MKKIVFIVAAVALMLAIQPEAKSQAALYNLLSTPYNLTKDTISNAATVTLTSGVVSGGSVTATVQVNITEISGTTAGTLTLFGSLNGTEWIALTDASAVPAIATKTATDVASQAFIWRVTGNPMRYYRVSWVGTGTMSDSFTAQLVVR
jgi:hypothetical protein